VKRPEGGKGRGPETRLLQLLALAKELCGLTERQRDAIRSGDWERLNVILDQKDRLIHAFQEMEASVKDGEAPEQTDTSPASAESLLAAIKSKLTDTQSIEEECERLLVEEKNRTAVTLGQIRRLHDGIRRFVSRRPGSARFVDLRK